MKWDLRFLELAKHIASWSKDPSTQCGAVLVRPDRTIASVGYNGFPSKFSDDERLDNREVKYEYIIHAEMNAMINAKEPIEGYTLYTWPFSPCPRCMVHMIQAKIKRIVFPVCKKPDWEERLQLSVDMMLEAGIDYKVYPNDHD